MTFEHQLKLQAYLDGELSAGEVHRVETWLTQDQEACSLLAELRNTRTALSGHESEIELHESREFYWSKIDREIQRLERPEILLPAISIFKSWQRFLIAFGALAAMVIAGVVVAPRLGNFGGARFSETETALADSGALTYRDYVSGTTLVWLSYPAENQFAETDSTDTIQ